MTTLASAPRAGSTSRLSRLVRSIWRGRETDAAWVRPALLTLLAGTAVLYFWNLSINGYANSFYSAAVQAGSLDWKAFFFGSSDMGNSITVDKPPASLWVMALSVRIFGLNSWAILAPQAAMGVGTVLLAYLIVRRRFSAGTAIAAGLATAVTPVATLMFRFNNPDALLLLLLTASVYWTIRAIEDGRTRWLILAGAAVGFGFLAKQLQAFLILPALAVGFLAFGPGRILRRIWQSLVAIASVVVAGGWWVAIVELWPADSRPYIGGSQNNSFLELTFGYNGLGRLTGDETGSVTGGGTSQWGETGITRLFGSDFAGQIAWLLPAALALAAVGLVLTLARPRRDIRRAILVVASGWLVTTWLAFSFMAGIFHQYYTVALVPPIAVVVAIVGEELWQLRGRLFARIVAAVVIAGSGAWAWFVLSESADFLPWLKWVVVVAATAAACGALALPLLGRVAGRLAPIGLAAATAIALLAGPTAYSLETIGTSHTGSIVTAGPSTSGGRGQGGPGGQMGGQGGPGQSQGGQGQSQGGPAGQMGQGGPGSQTTQGGAPGSGASDGGQMDGGGMGGGAGSLLGGDSASSELTALLQAGGSSYTWVAATVGSTSAANYQLASGYAVMPIGGFNGSDPSPTLEQFKSYVEEGKIHYFIASGVSGQSNGGSDAAQDIASWVSENFTATTVGGTTVYDLTSPSSDSDA